MNRTLPTIYKVHYIVTTQKFLENNGLWLKPVGKMLTNVCVNANIADGILPTLPRYDDVVGWVTY